MNSIKDEYEDTINLLKKYLNSFTKVVDNFKKNVNSTIAEKDVVKVFLTKSSLLSISS